MVQSLKQKGHVVAFIGRGIGDSQPLSEANVGLCFGTQGVEIVNACSAIVMSCKDFPFIIDILTWGRRIYDSVQIYTQFLLIASFVDLRTHGLNAVIAVPTGKILFSVFQLLWMKLIAGTLAVLALNIEKPSQDAMLRPRRNLKEPLITAQRRKSLFKEKDSLVLSTYILCQTFSIFNPRLLENIFEEMTDRLGFGQWGLCIAFSAAPSMVT
ncbi:putative calcium-transporting ATPase 13, plasma membrane-type, partial [Olea europaea var. sylvestris]|uniref:putative calcium-transporting ATPase 13, plasma membrane-type n=1 Tax=Olea europaea var. sylvestris TaxID=158386 RepID=UPI000C1CEC5C